MISISVLFLLFNFDKKKGRELPDQLSLEECRVENGSTLKLVLAMRGGPINTRRVVISSTSGRNTNEETATNATSSNHIEEIMMRNKEKILDNIPKNGQVSRFCPGNKVVFTYKKIIV